MAKKKQPAKKQIVNRRARFDYELSDDIVAGVALTGAESKNLRMGHGNLTGSYVTVKDNELWLLGAAIHGTSGIPIDEDAKTRTRKLLVKRRDIDELIAAKKQGKTIVPTKFLTNGKYIKVVIALGKGKKNYDKRETIKRRDQTRQAATEMKRF